LFSANPFPGYQAKLERVREEYGDNWYRWAAMGMVGWYQRYSHDKRLGQSEADARAARLGLWIDPNPVPPWCWRKMQKGRECQ